MYTVILNYSIMYQKLIYGFLTCALAFSLAGMTSAQTEDALTDEPTADTDEVVLETTSEDTEAVGVEEVLDEEELEVFDEELEGIEIDEPAEAPSRFGLFWRGVRERVALTFTFDEVKKAERRIKYAEERQLIAEKILEVADDPKAQERAQKVLNKASQMIEKVEEKKEKFLDGVDERKARLLKNIAAHEVRREHVFDRIEEKLHDRLAEHPEFEEKFEKFQELREHSLERGRGLLEAVQNVPDQVKEHIERVKARIDQKADEHRQFLESRRELLLEVKSGDEEAIQKLEDLKEDRKEHFEEVKEKRIEVRERVEEKKMDLREAAAEGDEEAAKKLEAVNRTQHIIRERVEDRRDKKEQVRDSRQDRKSLDRGEVYNHEGEDRRTGGQN
jgi:hypothetical protein